MRPDLEFQDIPGHPGYKINRAGVVLNVKTGRRSTGTLTNGYLYAQVGPRRRPVHCLLAETFLGDRPPGQVARHLNDVRTDNRLENLAWGTRADNAKDARRNGRWAPVAGSYHWNARLTEDAVRQIRAWISYGFGQAEIARWFAVHPNTVYHIKASRRWVHVQ